MSINHWEEHRILIWGKTYPELSSKYYETVCTGGTLADGRFIRLYPIPFRYLSDTKIFTKYQWVRAKIKKSKEDPRPESYKIDPESIVAEENIPADKFGWFNRSEYILKNPYFNFSSVEKLLDENKSKKTSLGFTRPSSIDKIEIENRPEEDYASFLKKISANKERLKQTEMFSILTVSELKQLQFISKRFKIHWHCKGENCKGHKMSILDWEVYELARSQGIPKTLEKLNTILDLNKYDIGFFLGNFRLYPNTFAIGGIWYPQKTQNSPNLRLF